MQEQFKRLDRIRTSADWRPYRDLNVLLETKGTWTHPAEVIQAATPEHLDKIVELARARLDRGLHKAPIGLCEVAQQCWLAASLDRLQDRTCWVHPSTVLGELSLEQLVRLRVGAEQRLQAPDARPGTRRIAAACHYAEKAEWMLGELAADRPAPQKRISKRNLRGILSLAEVGVIRQSVKIALLCRDEIARRTKTRSKVPRIDAIGTAPNPVLFWSARNEPITHQEFLELPDDWWLYDGKLCITLVDIPGRYLGEWRGPTYSTEEQRQLLTAAPYWQEQIGSAVVFIPDKVWPRRRQRIQVKPAPIGRRGGTPCRA